MKYIVSKHGNQDIEWLKEYTDDIVLYDKNVLGNVGNCDYDKLCWIVENYDNLPDVFALIKANLWKYISKEEFLKLKDNKVFTPLLTQFHKTYLPICWYENGIYCEVNNSWYVPQFESKFSSYNEWAKSLGLPTPEYLRFAPGGNYILTPKEIHRHPKELYVKMRDMLPYTQLPAEAQFCERTYYTLWKK